MSVSIASSKLLRRALYSFPGDHDEDLAFRAGDIITVLEEINEGWWLGEVHDEKGHTHCGIFPLNYTTELETPELPPPPPLPVKDCKLVQQKNPKIISEAKSQKQVEEQEVQNEKQEPQPQVQNTTTTATLMTPIKQDDNSNSVNAIPNDTNSTSQI